MIHPDISVISGYCYIYKRLVTCIFIICFAVLPLEIAGAQQSVEIAVAGPMVGINSSMDIKYKAGSHFCR